MLNKILYVARKVRGLAEIELAKVLGIDETGYKELEIQIKRMTPEYADLLSELFNVEPEFFLTYELGGMQDLTNILEKHRRSLDVQDRNQSVGGSHLAIARMGLEASIAIQENYVLLREKRDLEKENQALRELYQDLKSKKAANSPKPGNTGTKKI
jgi:transcriptional regulator with XRE-family HTH domain